MNNKIYFFKYALAALCVVFVAELSLAEGGDKGKDKSDNQNKPNATKVDSVAADFTIDAAKQDDTLVFEEWERPSGGSGEDGFKLLLKNKSVFSECGTSSSLELAACQFSSMGNTNESLPPKVTSPAVDFKLFPNPTVNELHLTLMEIPTSLRVADITGKEHISMSYTSTVQVSHLPTGTYFIQLIYSDHIESRKFIKE
jgi:hypothetical protein